MKWSKYTQNARLRERIERNYKDYKAEMTQLDSSSVFDFATKIAAVRDVYFMMTNNDWTDDTAEYLLKYENPLQVLACEWEDFADVDRGFEFADMLDVLIGDDCDEYCVAVSDADELDEKHSEDVSLITATIAKLVDLWEKHAASHDSKGGGVWSED